MRRLGWPTLILALLVVPLLSACGSSTSDHATTPDAARRKLAAMTLEQRIGQLLMVGTPAGEPSSATARTISRFHVGNVILMDKSTAGRTAIKHTVETMRRQVGPRSTSGVRLLIGVDQEGGLVQHLQGPGFARMPSALEQGTWSPTRLRAQARRWGRELRAADVNLALGPVADTVPPGARATNQPIGRLDRNFGYDPTSVAQHAAAFVRGMADVGVATSEKHFPGLGRVVGNTDYTSAVVDAVTRPGDPYLQPFKAAVDAGADFVMMSLASYPRLDPRQPAVFSSRIMQGVLRHDLGFRGVIVSDSLDATAVRRWTPQERAVRFLQAGGDMVLVTSADQVGQMYAALVRRARNDPAFARRVEDAALRVLRAKQAQGLL
ncbi:glycoside hydrolase family 3 protein [Nocardioides montaniterrae]